MRIRVLVQLAVGRKLRQWERPIVGRRADQRATRVVAHLACWLDAERRKRYYSNRRLTKEVTAEVPFTTGRSGL